MITGALARGEGSARLPDRRRWLILTALVTVIVIVAFGAFTVLSGPQMTSSANACSEATSAQCRPYLGALYESLGQRADEVASVRGRPWCGEDSCQILFGGEALRLRVTFHDGTAAEYICAAAALDEPSCEVADTR